MFKTRSLLIAAAMAAAAFACSAFESPPATASPRGSPVAAEAAKPNAVQAVMAAQKDVSPVSLDVAATGSGAESAFRAWTKQGQGAAVPVQKVSADAMGWHQRQASSELRTLHDGRRMPRDQQHSDVMHARLGDPCSAPRPST